MVNGSEATLAKPPTDSTLLRRLQKGDQQAGTQLYCRYVDRLLLLARAECSPDLARRLDAEDIVQSVFRSFLQGVNKGYYEVPSGQELWKLLLVIALNKIRAKGAFHRAVRRDVRHTVGGEFLDRLAPADAAGDQTAYVVLQLTVEEMVGSLAESRRQIIQLRIEGHEVAEIAAKTKRSKRTVERTLQEFRKRLAEILELK